MASVFEIAEKELQGIEFQRVTKMKLRVGALANALEDALQLAFEAFSQNSAYAGAELEIQKVPAEWKCFDCGRESEGHIGLMVCPYCQSIKLQLIRGQDLFLESLEVE